MVPNKKQCDLLKGKFAKGKAKTTLKSSKSTAKSMKLDKSPVKNVAASVKKPENNLRKIGIGMGGKNLALLKHERVSTSEQSSEDNNTPVKSEIVSTSPKEQKPLITLKVEDETHAQKAQGVKRKLNLEEYKMRRGGESVVLPRIAKVTKFESYKIPKLDNKSSAARNNTDNDSKIPIHTTTTKHSEAVTSIVRSLKEPQQVTTKTDPITEAKNKVLRMQELKKAQQMRIIDSAISAKVPKVTKLLPLIEIVKDTPYLNEEDKKTVDPSLKTDYEEIIIVSVSCNTDISIPPLPNQTIYPLNNASRSLLKSSALFSTITNTFEKVKANDNGKLSTSSLIASIQDVVVKKTLPAEKIEAGDNKDTSKPEHHGEDKIIMHLRKDRIRKRMCSTGIQTDLQPEFPPLALPRSSLQHKSRGRTARRHRKRQYRKHNEQSSSSSSSEYSSDEQSDNSNISTISRSRENSCSSSLERLRTYDSAIGTGGYSSRSSRKHRSSISSSYSESADRRERGRRQRRTSYTKRSTRKRSRSNYNSSSYSSDSDRSRSPHYRHSRSPSNSRTRSRSRRTSYSQSKNSNNFVDRNVSQPAVEERRIVYVGRIEQETTKDMLRRKFLQYGTIKQISIHYKELGK